MNPREYRAMFQVEDTHGWYVGLRREIWETLKRLPLPSPESQRRLRVLDAGCGTGGLLSFLLRQRNHLQAVGIDPSWEGLRFAQSRGIQDLLQGSMNRLPLASGSMDLVFCIDVICHTGVDEERALKEFHRVLRPGGWVLLQVPAFQWLRSEHDLAVSTQKRYTRREIGALCRKAGFTLWRNSYRNSFLFPLMAALRLIKRGSAIRPEEARSDVRPLPKGTNEFLSGILHLEAALSARGFRFPVGLSVFCVARKL